MNKIRLNHKKLYLCTLIFAQILLIASFFYVKIDNGSPAKLDNDRISFIDSKEGHDRAQITYHRESSRIFLKSVNSRYSYIDFNSSLCFVNGTDLVSMQRTKDPNWQCKCLSGWHGKDCGQPEVIWRAFLVYRKPIKIAGPRTFQRRIVYLFAVNKFTEGIADIRINELGDIVDLFVLYENKTDDFLKHKLNNKFVKEHHNKILYLQIKDVDDLWGLVSGSVKNLRDDDIILTSSSNEIPNKFALSFLKYYNNWPEPIRFRLRWSVFGFFWIHPARTIITGGACSVHYLKEVFNYKIGALNDNKTLSSPLHKGIILGDLNHYGGWYCEYCYDSAQILEYLAATNRVDLEKIDKKKIDSSYLEDVIENGLYIDGKTELIRAHKYRDNYFAPYYVIENNWKYDFMLINFYSKIDYYDG